MSRIKLEIGDTNMTHPDNRLEEEKGQIPIQTT